MSLWREGDKAEEKMKMGQRGSDKVMALVTPHASRSRSGLGKLGFQWHHRPT